MHITDLLNQAKGPQFSLEILPKRELSAEENIDRYAKILNRKPLFVDIPYHAARSNAGFSSQGDTVFIDPPGSGKLAEILIRNYQLNPQPHILCAGFTPEETEKKLLQFHDQGVRNLLLLRGDLTGNMPGKPGQHQFAYQLVEQVKNLNAGLNYRNEKISFNTDFCLGVGGYPEQVDLDSDLDLAIGHLKQKVEAGAHFIITQLFFDNERFFTFEKACRAAGILVPIIPGISPLTSFELFRKLPGFFQVSVPDALSRQIKNCSTKSALEETGTKWAIAQAKELYQHQHNCVHLFALSRPEILERVVTGLQ